MYSPKAFKCCVHSIRLTCPPLKWVRGFLAHWGKTLEKGKTPYGVALKVPIEVRGPSLMARDLLFPVNETTRSKAVGLTFVFELSGRFDM